MKSSKKNAPTAMDRRLAELEETAAQRNIEVHYDLLQAAGLKLKDGICKINGQLHIFIDRRKSTAAKAETLQKFLENPLPDDIPSNP